MFADVKTQRCVQKLKSQMTAFQGLSTQQHDELYSILTKLSNESNLGMEVLLEAIKEGFVGNQEMLLKDSNQMLKDSNQMLGTSQIHIPTPSFH